MSKFNISRDTVGYRTFFSIILIFISTLQDILGKINNLQKEKECTTLATMFLLQELDFA